MTTPDERIYGLEAQGIYTTSEIEEVFEIEMQHEREFPPGLSLSEVRARHRQMHESRDDWDHDHKETETE